MGEGDCEGHGIKTRVRDGQTRRGFKGVYLGTGAHENENVLDAQVSETLRLF